MATISRDNQSVWPFAVRRVGTCWLMTFSDRIPKIRCKSNSRRHALVPGDHAKRKSRDVICFTKDFAAKP